MEFFLVFMLGVALAGVTLFIVRPSLFTRPSQDFSYFEIMLEEALAELEEKQKEVLSEIEQEKQALLALHEQLLTTLEPNSAKSPKAQAVLKLAQEGQSASNIAKRLGLGTGEVQLILELEKEWKSLAEKD